MIVGSITTMKSDAFMWHDPWSVGSTTSVAKKRSLALILRGPTAVTRYYDSHAETYVLVLCCNRVGWVYHSMVTFINEPLDKQ